MAKVRTTADQIRCLKDSLPEGSPDNVVIIQNGRQPHLYMYTDTHSWKCHCDMPDTTRKYYIKRTDRDPLHLESAVFEKGYIVPNKARKAWSKCANKSIDITNRYSYTTPTKQDAKQTEDENEPDACSQPIAGMAASRPVTATGERNDLPAIKTTQKEKKRSRKKKKKVMVIDLSQGPITAQKPFRVSSAHWASGGHLQQWPWKGSLQCQLVTQSGNRHTAYSRHTHCWSHHKK